MLEFKRVRVWLRGHRRRHVQVHSFSFFFQDKLSGLFPQLQNVNVQMNSHIILDQTIHLNTLRNKVLRRPSKLTQAEAALQCANQEQFVAQYLAQG